NRGAKTFLAKYGKVGIDWAVAAATETLQEVAMVPIEKSLSNLLLDEKEPLLPKEEMVQAGMVGFGLSLVLGGLGASSSAIRSFSEDRVDKMLKHDITRREGALDIAEKVVDESTLDPAEKTLQRMEIEKARVCEKFGLDPENFKYTPLPKDKIEVAPVEEDTSKVIKELEDAGYGKEEDTAEELIAKHEGKKPKRGEVNDDKLRTHTMSKDEFVKWMMKNKELDPTDQQVGKSLGAAFNKEIPAQYTPVGISLSGKVQDYFRTVRANLILDP
ncbi:unnamed protein product, partial [marine sediment metagenome]